MTTFTENELAYLRFVALGRLATIGPGGVPQNHPVWYRVDAVAGTVDVGATDLTSAQKYRNVRADPRVSLVVDDIAAEPVRPSRQHGRGLEIRGRVEIVRLDAPLIEGLGDLVMRIHPRRVVAWNLDGDGYHARDVVRPGPASGS